MFLGDVHYWEDWYFVNTQRYAPDQQTAKTYAFI